MTVHLPPLSGLVLALWLVGCASHTPRIDCEKHLKAINLPAAVVTERHRP